MFDNSVPDDVRAALGAFATERTAARWTSLSQMFIRDGTVLDALQSVSPDFPDPLPLPVDGLVEDDSDFYQWAVLPNPDDVERAILHALGKT